jgi:hypothetical protein
MFRFIAALLSSLPSGISRVMFGVVVVVRVAVSVVVMVIVAVAVVVVVCVIVLVVVVLDTVVVLVLDMVVVLVVVQRYWLCRIISLTYVEVTVARSSYLYEACESSSA